MPRSACRAVLAAAALLALAPAPARAGRYATFTHEHFTLRLPGGWFVADWKPAANGRRAVPAKRPRAAGSASVVLVADRRGNYLSVFVDHANDGEFDAVWTLRAGPEGDTVEVGAEGKPCERGSRSPSPGPCSAGTRTREIATRPARTLRGHRYAFEFGNTERETGVQLDTFRWLLQGFRAR